MSMRAAMFSLALAMVPREFAVPTIPRPSLAPPILSEKSPMTRSRAASPSVPMTYAIPASLTKGKQKVTLKFAAHPGNIAGGVFGIRVLKSE